MPAKPLSVIKAFFFEGVPSRTALPQLKALTPEDREQLAVGITDGTFTY